VAMHLVQPYTGPYGALATGWLVFAGSWPASEWLKAQCWKDRAGVAQRL
jgi:hypothetical protein